MEYSVVQFIFIFMGRIIVEYGMFQFSFISMGRIILEFLKVQFSFISLRRVNSEIQYGSVYFYGKDNSGIMYG